MASRPQCNAIAMTFTAEASYATPVADGSINKRFDPQEPIILGLTKTKVDDSEKIKGHEFPTNPADKDIVIARDIEIPFSFDASVELLGLMMAIFFGADSVTGSGSNFIHTYKAANLCTLDQFPSVSWFLGLIGDTASFLKVRGVIVNELRLVLDSQGYLTLSGTAFTDGNLEADSSFTFPTVEHPVDFIVGTEANFLTVDAVLGVDACLQEDDSGGSFIDETADANSAGAGDVTVTEPFDTDDALLVGRLKQFSSISFLIDTPGVGDAVEAETIWEYSKGSDSWGTLADVVDGTTALTAAAGEKVLSFTIPVDWATDTVNSLGPFYWIRLRSTALIVYNSTTPTFTQIGNVNNSTQESNRDSLSNGRIFFIWPTGNKIKIIRVRCF